jgi:hypothetical protein
MSTSEELPPDITEAKSLVDSARPLMRSFFGPLLLGSIGLLTVALLAGSSFEYAVGYAGGKLFVSLALALPIFILLRYATRYGRRLRLIEQVNLFCILIAVVWLLQLILVAALPGYIASMSTSSTNPTEQGTNPQGHSSSVPRRPDASPRWEDYEPVQSQNRPSVAVRQPTPKGKCPTEQERAKAFGPYADLVPPCEQKSGSSEVSSGNSDVPGYESKGWTQDSTGSSEIGPWLNYSPPGTRYYRDAKRIIYRVYPPGVKPEAEPANPFGLGGSSAKAPE